MEVRLDLPPGTKAEVVQDEDENVLCIKLTPFFTARRSVAVLAQGKVINAHDEEISRFRLGVSGSSGQVTVKQRNESAVPLVDLSAQERAKLSSESASEADEDEEEEEDEHDDSTE